MKIDTVHPLQVRILRELLFKKQARFSELNVENIATDHFTFHLKQLVENGFLEKRGVEYELTISGKEFANQFDTEALLREKQAKLSVLVVGIKRESGVTRYLMQQRLKQPYFGYWGFVSGKIHWGEKIVEAAVREFFEETGLHGVFEPVGIEHKLDYTHTGEILEDKYFYIVRASKPRGKLIENFEGGRNVWTPNDAVAGLTNAFEDVPKILENLERKTFFLLEDAYNYRVDQY